MEANEILSNKGIYHYLNNCEYSSGDFDNSVIDDFINSMKSVNPNNNRFIWRVGKKRYTWHKDIGIDQWYRKTWFGWIKCKNPLKTKSSTTQ